MVSIFCKLERIGGYSGKRVQVKRITGMLIHSESFKAKLRIFERKEEEKLQKFSNQILEKIRKEQGLVNIYDIQGLHSEIIINYIKKHKIKKPLQGKKPKLKPNNIENVTFIFENKNDILKVKNEFIDLDNFMGIMKKQNPKLNNNYYNTELSTNVEIVLLKYQYGEVSKFGLINIKKILPIVSIEKDEHNRDFVDLNKGNYSFELKGIKIKKIIKNGK